MAAQPDETAPGRPVRIPSADESGAPGTDSVVPVNVQPVWVEAGAVDGA